MVQTKACQNFFHAFCSLRAPGQVIEGEGECRGFCYFCDLCSLPIEKRRQNTYSNCLVRMICLCMKLLSFLSLIVVHLVPRNSWFHEPCLFREKVFWSPPLPQCCLSAEWKKNTVLEISLKRVRLWPREWTKMYCFSIKKGVSMYLFKCLMVFFVE